MPEDSKKGDKKKHEPKEQRKPRQSRHQAAKSERKPEKNDETNVSKVPQQPMFEEPSLEFYKNLKRETDEIVKITEAENARYRKKEIQSNWAKYEMPLENYEDLDEQDVGADYEKLIQVPLSAGGHFQFKHEKTWDTSTAPSLYNKYFDFNMDSLSTAISTIPFYERNDINLSEFSDVDILSMTTRASKYKSKYYNNTSLSLEMTAQDKILKSFKENNDADNIEISSTKENEQSFEALNDEDRSDIYQVNLDFNVPKASSYSSMPNEIVKQDAKTISQNSASELDKSILKNVPDGRIPKDDVAIVEKNIDVPKNISASKSELSEESVVHRDAVSKEIPVDSKANPVIQSPEELEKWLDDFLDS